MEIKIKNKERTKIDVSDALRRVKKTEDIFYPPLCNWKEMPIDSYLHSANEDISESIFIWDQMSIKRIGDLKRELSNAAMKSLIALQLLIEMEQVAA